MLQYSVYTAAQIIIVWVFFIFESPHDCFTCIGKDPDRKYSIHQYTYDQLLERKMLQKFGRRSIMEKPSTLASLDEREFRTHLYSTAGETKCNQHRFMTHLPTEDSSMEREILYRQQTESGLLEGSVDVNDMLLRTEGQSEGKFSLASQKQSYFKSHKNLLAS